MMTLFSSFRRHLCLMILCMGSWTVAPAQSELRVLGTDTPTSCTRCEGVLLPGGPVYPSSPVYSIHSDLPEIFHTPGVLYTTRKVLPPFDTYKDGPLPEAMRTQRASADYKGVDGDFEVFLYHMTEPGNGRSPRRVAVLVENTGTEPVVVTASEIMETTGPMGKPGGPEIRLSNRYHSGQWTQRFGEIEIAPGDMEVVSLTPRFGDGPGSPWIGTEFDNVPQQDRSTLFM